MKRIIFATLLILVGLPTMLVAKPKHKHAPKPCTMEVLAANQDTTGLTCADPPKKQPHWYEDKKWWFGEAVITAAIVADAHSTSRGVGLGLKEQNTWAFGSNPSNRRIALVSLGYFGIQSSLHAAAWHVTHHVPVADSCHYWTEPYSGRIIEHCTEFAEDRLGWRITGYVAIPAVVAIINGHNAARNYALK